MVRFSSRNVWKGTALLFKEKHAHHPSGRRGGGGAAVPTTQEPLCFTAQLVFPDMVSFVKTVGYLE